MKREHIVENNDLIKKEKKLKRQNFLSNLLIIVLLIVAISIAYKGYIGEKDSWFFKNYLDIDNTSEEEEIIDKESEVVKEENSTVYLFSNKVTGGYTKYVITNAESGWSIYETDLLSDQSGVLEIDLAKFTGVGDTKAILTTEYYGGFGNLIDSEEEEIVISVPES